MKKMKKLTGIFGLAVLLCCLTACGQTKDTEDGGLSKDHMSSNGSMPTEDSMASADSLSSEDSKSEVAAPSKDDAQVSPEESKEPGEMTETSDNGNGNNTDGAEVQILVAYFSATGTTKKLAEYAAEIMNADLYEIVPEQAYTEADLNYNDKNSRTSIEMNDASIKPAMSGSVADMAQYDIVFIGYPIWWGDAPHIMDTFMESHDFSGKTIVPFCTSGSSGIGSSAKGLQDYTDSSVTWLDGKRFSGSASKEDMADWISGLSLGIGDA